MAAPDSLAAVRRHYRWVASIYDRANLERLLYADARAKAVELLDLQSGARVLDVACGTGAKLRADPAADRRVRGARWRYATPEMLDQARAPIGRT